ncbi:hypothetical protein MsAg5_07870 [Methanosarcinaceae archaeon Ag5]|uniref:Uncharacterized protein n=1 Tax=Methanolapillus africanus TaxID=3028297 RepID=A0AAE4MHY8_9EURY|nr:hypothetical protein [Methanosarcinaceae archaeon Ag5]
MIRILTFERKMPHNARTGAGCQKPAHFLLLFFSFFSYIIVSLFSDLKRLYKMNTLGFEHLLKPFIF